MKDPTITPELIEKHGLTTDEYEQIKKTLGRVPRITELGIFSVMWSEHCSYKNSRPELKKFPTSSKHTLIKAGEENAGVLDIGGKLAVSFKIESHNHPSAIEPFQGAATGVGGIIRDIFTMGARPLFSMNSLRFGEIRGASKKAQRNRRLLSGVVEGIAHYGNCIGIPTVGGELQFDPSFDGNPLVNVFCLGFLKHSQIRRGAARGVGNPVFYVGAPTGRDGLAGAAFASRDLTEASKEDRPAVQVGDPFMEKLLLEACLELFEIPDAVVGVQDMGAAGLTCSTCETASRAGLGIEIDLDTVPQRESGMDAYEIMLSESQERMLIIGQRGHEEKVLEVFKKWDLPVAEIGTVTDDGLMRVRHHGEVVAEISAKVLADEAPVYHREAKRPEGQDKLQTWEPLEEKPWEEETSHQELLKMCASPNLCSKRWVYEQFDHDVRIGTVVKPGGDAAVVRVKSDDENGGHYKYLAATLDCNARYCLLDPRRGSQIAVAEGVRNLAMVGARPIGATDNLNFGNPHNPEIFWQLRESVEGISEACRFFDIPITGGNVSLYNQSPQGAIDPTPTMGIVGMIGREEDITKNSFRDKRDAVLLLGGWGSEMGGSLYASEIHNKKCGIPPEVDLEKEKKLQESVLALIRMGLVKSAHDLSEGGLAITLVESCLSNEKAPQGAKIKIPSTLNWNETLYNESQARAVLSVRHVDTPVVQHILGERGVPFNQIGEVGGKELLIEQGEKKKVRWSLEELKKTYENTLGEMMEEA